MIQKSKKSLVLIPLIISLFLLPILILFFDNKITLIDSLPIFIILFSIDSYIIYSYFNTKYEIKNNYLHYQCGFFKDKISVKKIRKITYNNSIFVPVAFKHGFHHKGLIILFEKFDEIFISPENRELFVNELLKINPTITLINNE